MARATKGPREGVPQPWVKYCPVCKSDIGVVGTNQYNGKELCKSHSYQCLVCDRIFEINLLDRRRDPDDLFDSDAPYTTCSVIR